MFTITGRSRQDLAQAVFIAALALFWAIGLSGICWMSAGKILHRAFRKRRSALRRD